MNYFVALLFFVSLNLYADQSKKSKLPVIDAYITVLDPQHLTSVRVSIENSKEDNKIKRSEINFGDGFVSNKKDVIHQYAQDGVYNINIKVWDNKNTMSQYSKFVDVASNLVFRDGTSVYGPYLIHDNRKLSFPAPHLSADKKYKLVLTKQNKNLAARYYEKYLKWYERHFKSIDQHEEKEKFEVNVELNNIEIFVANEITENTLKAEKFVILKSENKLKFEIEHARKNKYAIELIELDFVKDTEPPVLSSIIQSGGLTNNAQLPVAISDISGEVTTIVWIVLPDGTQQQIISTNELNFNIPLVEGVNNFIVQTEDQFHNRSELIYLDNIVLDTIAPALVAIAPASDAVTYTYQLPFDKQIDLSFSEEIKSVSINGASASIDAGTGKNASALVPIAQAGPHALQIVAIDHAGNVTQLTQNINVVHVTSDPVLDITFPINLLTNENTLSLPFSIVTQVPIKIDILLNDVIVYSGNSLSAAPNLNLSLEGVNNILINVYYAAPGFDIGLKYSTRFTVVRDTIAPSIASALPASGSVIYTNTLPVTLPVNILFSESLSQITVNNILQPNFSSSYATDHFVSAAGVQQLQIQATDRAGNTASLTHFINVDFSDTLPILSFNADVKNLLTNKISVPISGTSDKILTSVNLNGVPISIGADGKSFYGIFDAPKNGRYKLDVAAIDRYGNTGSSSTYIRVLQGLPDQVLPAKAPRLVYDPATRTYLPDFGSAFNAPQSDDVCAALDNVFEQEAEFKDNLATLESNLQNVSDATGIPLKVPLEQDLKNFMGDVDEALNYIKSPYMMICKGINILPNVDCPTGRRIFNLVMGSYPEPLIVRALPIPVSAQNFLIPRLNICTGFDDSGLSCNDLVAFLPLIADFVLPGTGQILGSQVGQAVTEALLCKELCDRPIVKDSPLCTEYKLPDFPEINPIPTGIALPPRFGGGGGFGGGGNWGGGGGWPGGGGSCGGWFEPDCDDGGGGGGGGSGSFLCSSYSNLWFCGANGENSRDRITIDDRIDCASLANSSLNDLIIVGNSFGILPTVAFSSYVAKCVNSPVPGYPKSTKPVLTVSAPVQNQEVTDTVRVTGYVDDDLAQVQVNGQLVLTTLSIFGAAFDVVVPVPADAVVRVEAADLFGNRAVPVEVGLSLPSVGVTDVDVGATHLCAIKGGAVKCLGENWYGELGAGEPPQDSKFHQVIGLTSGVSKVAVNETHSCAIMNGGVNCWGRNNRGQLGNNSIAERVTSPVNVSNINSGATDVVLGSEHSCAIVNGGAMCWGANYAGQLGNGSFTDSLIPVSVDGLESGVKQVASGGLHSCALLENNTVKCWGYNVQGQLSIGNFSSKNAPALVPLNDVKFVAASGLTTCFILINGSVMCAGDNGMGQLGNGTKTNSSLPVSVLNLSANITQVDISERSACAIDSNGAVYCWGFEIPVTGLGQSLTPIPALSLTSNTKMMATGTIINCAIVGPDLKCWGRKFGIGIPTIFPF